MILFRCSTRHRSLVAILAFASLTCAAACPAAEQAAPLEMQVAELKAENERLRTLLPGQSHAMIDVAYHFTNLWFAAQARNWPLAQFYFNETRNRIGWALRLTPVRKLASGELVLQPVFDAFDKAQLTALKQAIADKDVAKFEQGYEGVAAGCTACHVAAEKPYLHIVKPRASEAQVVQFDP